MRLLRTTVQYSVIWVLLFVLTAGPLPLGIPRAMAAAGPVTDVPGIRNYFAPKVFIIFDTSKSMEFKPADLNGDVSVLGQDWDPTIPTPAAQCQNKFCLGKKALYETLPKYTSRLELGLSGYNQYYQLTTVPPTLFTNCTYDQFADGNANWGAWQFRRLTDLTGTLTDGTQLQGNSPEVWYQPSNASPECATCTGKQALTPHRTRKWAVSTGDLGDLMYLNVTGAGTTADQIQNGFTYNWMRREDAPGRDSRVKTGPCPATIPNQSGGTCGAQSCDLIYAGEHTVLFPSVVSGTDLGSPATIAGNPYTLGAVTHPTFSGSCALGNPYAGAGAGCNAVMGGCNLTRINGPYDSFFGPVDKRFQNLSPGPGWQQISTSTGTVSVKLTTSDQVCPPVGTVVTPSSGPPEWRPLSIGQPAVGLGTAPDCNASLPYQCTWTFDHDLYVNTEIPQHFCVFTRPEWNFQQSVRQCDWQTDEYRYDAQSGTDYCDYKHQRDVFSAPIYTYSFIPNDGDLLGSFVVPIAGRDDLNGVPSPVTYSGGQFSNGDCPNYIASGRPECTGGVLCKLSWKNNTTIGVTNYPFGRYSNSPWGWTPWLTGLVAVADPPATWTDPLWPPSPMAYAANWLAGGGQDWQYLLHLVANIYQPAAPNPPAPPAFACPTCTYQYSYTRPATKSAADFAAVAAPMPPLRNSGWARLPDPDGRKAISWEPLALNNALKGAIPSSDGPLLRMLSKFDPVNNPAGLQTPDLGDYTPLTGSLTNARDYIRTVINTDPYAGCGRAYYVMLLTDGEEQPATLGNDPVAAVRSLRDPPHGGTMTTSLGVPVDVKTFVIGFGLQSPQLDSMAQVGGTSVAPDLETPDPAGRAFDASSPDRLLRSLEASFGAILSGYFTRSKPAVNLAADEMYVGYFRLLFNGVEWQGKLDAIDLTDPSHPIPSVADTVTDGNYSYLWRYGMTCDSPGCTVAQGLNWQAARTVYTSLTPNSGNRIYFDYPGGWNSNAGADQAALDAQMAPLPADAEAAIALLLNKGAPGAPQSYSTGDPKRSRASDIFHSNPAIVEGAAQSASWPDATESAAYSGFRSAVLARKKTVYIGANDGMLHAVEDAVTRPAGTPVIAPEAGSERWAYVPNQLLPILTQMRDGHTYGVDGSMGVADVCGAPFAGAPCTDPLGWRTLLVGALGKGGHGVYALDITDAADPHVLWETSSSSDMVTSRTQLPRFGETWSAPVIARTNVVGPGKVWSVFLGGGVESLDPVKAWGNTFYVLDARTGKVLQDSTSASAAFSVWDDPADPSPNGVAARPTVFRPGDTALASRVYFNDTEGKVWRMDVSGTSVSSWDPNPTHGPADAFFDPNNAGGNGACVLDVNGLQTQVIDATTGLPVLSGGVPVTLPLSNPVRPRIFNRPMLAYDPTGVLDVYLGTGDSEHPNDPFGTWDYFYGLTDLGTGCARPLFVLRFAQNEKMLADPAFLQGVVFGTTYLPPTGSNCSDAGRGFLYAWDALTGQPVKAIKDPFNPGVMVSKLDLGQNAQLGASGIPSAPLIRNGKIYVSVETDPSHPRVIDTNAPVGAVKVKGWQRVK